jgi:hypothetical protein
MRGDAPMIRPPPRYDVPSPPFRVRIWPTFVSLSFVVPWNSQKAFVARLRVF